MGCTSLQTIATATLSSIQMPTSSGCMIRKVAARQVLEAIKRPSYTCLRMIPVIEDILAYFNRRGIGCLRRSKKVHIRSLRSELLGSIWVSKTRLETGSDGSLNAVQAAENFYLDQKTSSEASSSIRQHGSEVWGRK